MPLPKPKKNEKKKDFIDRCMSNEVMKDEYKDNDQRLAVCYSLWDQTKKSDNPEMEYRVLNFEDTEIRVDDDKPVLVGYAAKTNSWTDLGFFKERIKPGAFGEVLDDDVRCLKNHDPNLILGRTTNGTLRLSENTVGLHFENDIPDTTTGKDTREEVRSKLITGCSFAFTIAEEDWKYYEDERLPERTILKIKKLYDVGPVTYPAYQDTTVAARSLESFKSENIETANAGEDVQAPETEENAEEKQPVELVDDNRQREIKRKYRQMGRLKNRCEMALEKMDSAKD